MPSRMKIVENETYGLLTEPGKLVIGLPDMVLPDAEPRPIRSPQLSRVFKGIPQLKGRVTRLLDIQNKFELASLTHNQQPTYHPIDGKNSPAEKLEELTFEPGDAISLAYRVNGSSQQMAPALVVQCEPYQYRAKGPPITTILPLIEAVEKPDFSYSTCIIEGHPSRPFQPAQIVIEGDDLQNVEVENPQIGTCLQFVAIGACNAKLFAYDRTPILSLDTLAPNDIFQLRLRHWGAKKRINVYVVGLQCASQKPAKP